MRPILELRARLMAAVRRFFVQRGFLEVETPVLIAAPAQEEHIDAIPAGNGWLRTSPELHMKRLLAAGCDRIFQIGSCFRQGEYGTRHNPEFCMLEWYRAPADYLDALADAEALIAAVAAQVLGASSLRYQGVDIDLQPPWPRFTIAEAFRTWAGWDPTQDFDADRFNEDLAFKIEPALPHDRPAVLLDFPVLQAALARCRASSPPVAERWELYVGGLELANAFSELTDAVEQRRRFEYCAAQRRAAGKTVYPLDEKFLAAVGKLPSCAGVALGLDRLLMLLANAATFDEVLPFRMA